MALIDTNIVSAPGGSLTPDTTGLAQLIGNALTNKAKQDKEDVRLKQVEQVEQAKLQSDRNSADLQAIFMSTGDETSKRKQLSSLIEGKIKRGEDVSIEMEALSAQGLDNLNLAVGRGARALANKSKVFEVGLQADRLEGERKAKGGTKGFTLSPGQQRFDAGGKPIAEVGKTDILSEEAFQQKKELKQLDVNLAVKQAIAVEGAKQQISEKSPTGQLKKQLLEGKVADQVIKQKKTEMRQESQAAKAAIVEGKIDEAIALTDKWFTTGFLGGMMSAIGGTDARNLRGTIDTIQANLGFAELQAMRDASPTGGALGQVAVRELELLQSTLASLDQSQDDDILLQNLEQVRAHIQNWKQAVNQSTQSQDIGAVTDQDIDNMTPEQLQQLDAQLKAQGL